MAVDGLSFTEKEYDYARSIGKPSLNFLDLLRAGHTDYMLNEAAFSDLRSRGLAAPVIVCLAEADEMRFVDQAAWQAHLNRIGIVSSTKPGLGVIQDPVLIATEGAQWGSIHAHAFLQDAVVLSDDAGQFDIVRHALCWVHAERLVHIRSVWECCPRLWRSGCRSIPPAPRLSAL